MVHSGSQRLVQTYLSYDFRRVASNLSFRRTGKSITVSESVSKTRVSTDMSVEILLIETGLLRVENVLHVYYFQTEGVEVLSNLSLSKSK